MSISPLSNQAYASLLSGLSGSTNSAAGSTASSGSLGDQLLAELAQSQSSSATSSSDPLLQELVSLSPAATGQTTASPQTYNAQGLLQEIQSSMMLNDPLLQTDSTGTSDTNSSSLLQSLLASSQTSTSGSKTATTSSTNALSQALATTSTT